MATNPFTELELKLDTLTGMVAELSKQLNGNPNPVSLNKPLNIQQAADYLDMAKGTLYNLTSKRLVPHFKRGARVLFNITELDQWLKANKQKTVTEIEQEA